MHKYKHILWDWNGTLIDDGWLFVNIMNSILVKRKMKSITLKKYRQMFCFPVKDYYIKLGFDFNKENFEQCGTEFIKEYEKHKYTAKLYSKVPNLLMKLKLTGISNSILSAQHQIILNDLVKYYNLNHFFENIVGLDNHYANSKIENGINLVKKINVNHESILMIGDTYHDYEVAKTIGIDCFLLSHGHNSYKKLKNTGSKIFKNINELFLELEL